MWYNVTSLQDSDLNFTVRANNDSELINTIAETIDDRCNEDYYDDRTLDDYDGSTWQVRELGEPFEVELSISRKISGKRC